MFIPFGATEKVALNDFTQKDMGVPEEVTSFITIDSDTESELNTDSDSDGSFASTTEPLVDGGFFFIPSYGGTPGNSGSIVKESGPEEHEAKQPKLILLVQTFADALKPGDNAMVIDFNRDA